MLELLASPPGTGKTTYCIELFKNEILKSMGGIDSRSFFVLPSREHAERIQNLILKKDVPGLFNAHVVTINDLASRLTGMPAIPQPTEAVRQAFIREVLGSSAHWPYLDRAKELPGFHKIISELIREFSSSLMSIKDFETRSQPLLKSSVFRSKFRDISVLLKNYNKRLEAFGLAEPEDAIAHLVRARLQPGSVDLVVLDGFYHFSGAQQELIRVLTRVAKKVVVTLTVSPTTGDRPELFYYPERTRAYLKQLGFVQKKQGLSGNHRFMNPAIAHLEKQLFSPHPQRYPEKPDGVLIIEAPGPRAEIEMIARQIRRFCRQSPVYLSDICVLLRGVSPYQKIIESVFNRFGIPVHIHERYRLRDTALAGYLTRFFTLCLSGWQRPDLFFLLKSGFHVHQIDLKDVLAFERAAKSANVTQGSADWMELALRTKAPDGLKRGLDELLTLQNRVLGSRHSKAFASEIRGLIRSLGPNEPEAERAIEQMLRAIERFTNAAGTFMPLQAVEQFKAQLESGLYSIKPPGKNRVQVYDVVMALPKEYKIVFIAGLLERTFPQAITEEAVFKDHERRVINRAGPALEERGQRAAGERYFFYMALSRARQQVVLTYPLYDADGRPALPSFFVQAVRECFSQAPETQTRHLDEFLPGPYEWETEDEVIRGLSEWTGQSFPRALSRWTEQSRFLAVKESAVRPQCHAAISDPEVLKSLASLKGPYSATRLEKLAVCPFRYFASEVLRLNEPFEGHETAWMGSLLHKALELYFKSLSLKDRREGSYLRDRAAMLGALVRFLEQEARKSPLASEPAYRFRAHLAQMRRTLERFVQAEAEIFSKRKFIPSAFELTFGAAKDSDYPALEITTPEGKVKLRGQIDRVDISPDGRQALVVDYKRSERGPVRKKFETGLELQLPIYMLAVRKFLKVDTPGAEHRYLTQATRAGLYREDVKGALALHHSNKTYPVEDFEARLKAVASRIGSLAAQLKSGDIAVRSRSCQWCHFGPVCRFEKWRLAYQKTENES